MPYRRSNLYWGIGHVSKEIYINDGVVYYFQTVKSDPSTNSIIQRLLPLLQQLKRHNDGYCGELVIKFDVSGYYDQGSMYGSDGTGSPPEGDEERTPISVYLKGEPAELDQYNDVNVDDVDIFDIDITAYGKKQRKREPGKVYIDEPLMGDICELFENDINSADINFDQRDRYDESITHLADIISEDID